MPLADDIKFAPLDQFLLDPSNPRLGLVATQNELPIQQDELLSRMQDWSLEELAVSFLESGFWLQEAVIVIHDDRYGTDANFLVVEGNRRIAALKCLVGAAEGQPLTRRWRSFADNAEQINQLAAKVPYILADSRDDVVSYLGFRHVTGIKQWEPGQKAQFIAYMIELLHMDYETVRKRVGMQRATVKRNYIAHCLVNQIRDCSIEVSLDGLERRFSVLYLALREDRIRTFLAIADSEKPADVRVPVPPSARENLAHFARWLFGTDSARPLFSDSRYVGDFAQMLTSEAALDYLRSTKEPIFDLALQKAGIEDVEIETQLKEASNQMELALSRVHLYTDSDKIRNAMRRFALSARELLAKFPDISSETGIRFHGDNDA